MEGSLVNTMKVLCVGIVFTACIAWSGEAAQAHKRVHHASDRRPAAAYNYAPETKYAPDRGDQCYVPLPFTVTCDH